MDGASRRISWESPLNSLVLAAAAVNTRLVLTVGVNVRLTFGRENLIGKDKMFEA